MHRPTHWMKWLLLMIAAMTFAGCSYFNTYYNAKRRFAEAEKELLARQSTQPPAQQGQAGQPPGQRVPPPAIPMDKYRKVIETGSKLLESYPKSRWIDDALFIMGISYFRMGDFPRADRKFSEIITFFPASRHVPDALVWRARVLSEQKKPDEAIEQLSSAVGRLKNAAKRADAVFQLGSFLFDAKRWGDAAEQFAVAAKLSQSRAQRAKAFYYLGLANFERKSYSEAREAFGQAIRLGQDRAQSYSSFLYSARCAAAVGNIEEAQAILTRVAGSERFLDFAGDTRLELAAMAVSSGAIKDAVAKYEEFLSSTADNERRGVAFYRLAIVQRDHLHDLLKAKALLDSVGRSGTKREIIDSARAALDNLNRGLISIERIKLLKAQIDSLERNPPADTVGLTPADNGVAAQTESLHGDSVPLQTHERDSMSAKSQRDLLPEGIDSLRFVPTSDSMATVARDTAKIPSMGSGLDFDHAPSQMTSPAMVLSDSIAQLVRRALREADSLKAVKEASGRKPSDSARVASNAERSTPGLPAADATRVWTQRLSEARRNLQSAYLHVAEFYAFNLSELDSALAYYRLAASSNANAEVHWKANLFLGEHYQTIGDSSAARPHFESVAAGDSVPLAAANVAREALGLPLIEAPLPPQVSALRVAESARTAGAPPESLIVLYDRAAQFGAETEEGRIALMAKGYIHEYELKNVDSARAAYEQVIAAYPDSSFSDILRGKVQPPDTASIFLLSEEDLQKRIRPQAAVFEEKPDSTGWPPPEESLRGRRFR